MRKKLTLVTSLAFAAALCAGVGAANVQADAAANYSDFAITATAVRVADPSGLRFKVDCPTTEVENAYTVLTMTTAAGVFKTAEVPATVWRKDNTGWNTVLLGIPDTDYVTEVTAQAFVTIKGVEYETGTVTSSIAKTASSALNAGLATEDQVGAYVAGKVTSITLDVAANLKKGETKKLTAEVAPAGYAVVWASDDTGVATVDKDGNVKAVGVGTANITASMGGVSATCVVTVEDYFDGTFGTVTDADLATLITKAYTHGSNFAMGIVTDPKGENGNVLKFERKLNHSSAPKLDLNVPAYLLNKMVAGNILSMQVYGEASASDKLIVSANGTTLFTATSAALNGWVTLEVKLTDALVAAIKAKNDGLSPVKAENTIRFEVNGNSDHATTYYIDNIAITAPPVFDGTFENWSTELLGGGSGYGTIKSYSVAVSPTDANNKVLKVEATNVTNNPIFKFALSDEFIAQMQVGGTLSFKVYGEKYSDNVKAMFTGVASSTSASAMLKTETGSSWLYLTDDAWTEFSVVLTESFVTTLQDTNMLFLYVATDRHDSTTAKGGTFYFDEFKVNAPPALDGTFETVTDADLATLITKVYTHGNNFAMGIVTDPKGENGNVLKFERKLGHSSAPKLDLNVPAGTLNQIVAGKTLSMQVYGVASASDKLIVSANGTSLFTATSAALNGWVTLEVELTDALVAAIKANNTIRFEVNGNSDHATTYYIDNIVVK